MYTVSNEEIIRQQDEYKRNYPTFYPYEMSQKTKDKISEAFFNVVKTQNGQDTDDYPITVNNSVNRYLNKFKSGSKVLLLGTGTGREVLAAKELGFQAVGTTLGSRNVFFGHEYLELKEDELIECLNEDLPFEKETFDVVAGFQVFEHTMAPLLFLLEQSRILKKGGTIILEWPPPKDYTMDDNPHHQVCFVPGQAHGLLRKAGFGGIKLYYNDLSPISEEDWWRGDQDKMFCIEGIKVDSTEEYIKKARGF